MVKRIEEKIQEKLNKKSKKGNSNIGDNSSISYNDSDSIIYRPSITKNDAINYHYNHGSGCINSCMNSKVLEKSDSLNSHNKTTEINLKLDHNNDYDNEQTVKCLKNKNFHKRSNSQHINKNSIASNLVNDISDAQILELANNCITTDESLDRFQNSMDNKENTKTKSLKDNLSNNTNNNRFTVTDNPTHKHKRNISLKDLIVTPLIDSDGLDSTKNDSKYSKKENKEESKKNYDVTKKKHNQGTNSGRAGPNIPTNTNIKKALELYESIQK